MLNWYERMHMENRNLDKALDIVSKLITGENVSERGENAALYQEYNNNAEVYDIVHMSLKKLNLNIYEYNNGLYVSAGDNNRVFGYSNEELRNVLGLRVNKELYLAYFIIYNIITEFYSDTMSSTYAEFIRLEDIIKNVDKTTGGIVDKSAGLVLDEVEENSFKTLALLWDELPVTSTDDVQGQRAARNSKTGYVKLTFNFLVAQGLFVENQDKYYPTDRFKAMAENYYSINRGRLYEILTREEQEAQNATD